MIDEIFKRQVEEGFGAAVILAGSGSDSDHIQKISGALEVFSIPYNVRIASAHKQPEKLMELVREYDALEGPLTYVAVAGGTDALSGTLAFNTYRLVISCPPDAPNESCLTNPPGSSNVYVGNVKNTVRAVAQSLSSFDPKLRKLLQETRESKIEKLVKSDQIIQDSYAKRQRGD
jgi:5-(carboxyamino)imidazole ribonucleotide mutase